MEDTKPKTYVFVLMPFTDQFKDIYEVGIKSACKDAGAYCERVDEQIFDESILERIYNQIAKADVIVADMSGRNPNVFYETGYAHALNKRVILLTQDANDIPFDLKHYPHIVYEGRISLLKTQLESRIRWCIENPKDSLSNVDVDLDLFVNGISIMGQAEICVTFSSDQRDQINRKTKLKIDVHNSTTKRISPSEFNLALLLPLPLKVDSAASDRARRITKLPDGISIYSLPLSDTLKFPDGWASSNVVLTFDSRGQEPESPALVTLRLYTGVGPRDYPFALVCDTANDST